MAPWDPAPLPPAQGAARAGGYAAYAERRAALDAGDAREARGARETRGVPPGLPDDERMRARMRETALRRQRQLESERRREEEERGRIRRSLAEIHARQQRDSAPLEELHRVRKAASAGVRPARGETAGEGTGGEAAGGRQGAQHSAQREGVESPSQGAAAGGFLDFLGRVRSAVLGGAGRAETTDGTDGAERSERTERIERTSRAGPSSSSNAARPDDDIALLMAYAQSGDGGMETITPYLREVRDPRGSRSVGNARSVGDQRGASAVPGPSAGPAPASAPALAVLKPAPLSARTPAPRGTPRPLKQIGGGPGMGPDLDAPGAAAGSPRSGLDEDALDIPELPSDFLPDFGDESSSSDAPSRGQVERSAAHARSLANAAGGGTKTRASALADPATSASATVAGAPGRRTQNTPVPRVPEARPPVDTSAGGSTGASTTKAPQRPHRQTESARPVGQRSFQRHAQRRDPLSKTAMLSLKIRSLASQERGLEEENDFIEEQLERVRRQLAEAGPSRARFPTTSAGQAGRAAQDELAPRATQSEPRSAPPPPGRPALPTGGRMADRDSRVPTQGAKGYSRLFKKQPSRAEGGPRAASKTASKATPRANSRPVGDDLSDELSDGDIDKIMTVTSLGETESVSSAPKLKVHSQEMLASIFGAGGSTDGSTGGTLGTGAQVWSAPVLAPQERPEERPVERPAQDTLWRPEEPETTGAQPSQAYKDIMRQLAQRDLPRRQQGGVSGSVSGAAPAGTPEGMLGPSGKPPTGPSVAWYGPHSDPHVDPRAANHAVPRESLSSAGSHTSTSRDETGSVVHMGVGGSRRPHPAAGPFRDSVDESYGESYSEAYSENLAEERGARGIGTTQRVNHTQQTHQTHYTQNAQNTQNVRSVQRLPSALRASGDAAPPTEQPEPRENGTQKSREDYDPEEYAADIDLGETQALRYADGVGGGSSDSEEFGAPCSKLARNPFSMARGSQGSRQVAPPPGRTGLTDQVGLWLEPESDGPEDGLEGTTDARAAGSANTDASLRYRPGDVPGEELEEPGSEIGAALGDDITYDFGDD